MNSKQDKLRKPIRYRSTRTAVYLYLMDMIYTPKYSVIYGDTCFPVVPIQDILPNIIRPDLPTGVYEKKSILDCLALQKSNPSVSLGEGTILNGHPVKHKDVGRFYFRDNNLYGLEELFGIVDEAPQTFFNRYQTDSDKTCWTAILNHDCPLKPSPKYHTLRKMIEGQDVFGKHSIPGMINNTKLYFPDEGQYAFENWIRELRGLVDSGDFSDYSALFSTRYMQVCLNRQFVLNILKRNLGRICFSLEERPEDESGLDGSILQKRIYVFETGLDWHYRKVCEDIGSVEKVRTFVSSLKDHCIRERKVDIQSFLNEMNISVTIGVNHQDMDDEDLKRFTETYGGLIGLLDDEFKARINASEALEDMTLKRSEESKNGEKDKDDGTVKMFDVDPDGSYRSENPFMLPYPDNEGDQDVKVTVAPFYLGDVSDSDLLNVLKGSRCSKINSVGSPEEVSFNMSDVFIRTAVDNLISSVLALIQYSPHALFYFVCEQGDWSSHADQNMRGLIDRLIKLALTDHMNREIIGRAFPMKCRRIGSDEHEDINSVMGFSAGDGGKILFSWSESVGIDNSFSCDYHTNYIAEYRHYDARLVES